METIKKELRRHLAPEQLRSDLCFFAMLNLGLVIYAVTLNFYCAPNHFVFGGTTGLSIVLSTCFPALSVGTFMWIANAVLDVLGVCISGDKDYGLDAVLLRYAQLLFQRVRKAVSHVPAFNG